MKVVLLRTENVTENNQKNSDLFIQELNSINSKIGAKITYDILDSEFKETKNNHELRLKQMIDKIYNINERGRVSEERALKKYGGRLADIYQITVLNKKYILRYINN